MRAESTQLGQTWPGLEIADGVAASEPQTRSEKGLQLGASHVSDVHMLMQPQALHACLFACSCLCDAA